MRVSEIRVKRIRVNQGLGVCDMKHMCQQNLYFIGFSEILGHKIVMYHQTVQSHTSTLKLFW